MRNCCAKTFQDRKHRPLKVCLRNGSEVVPTSKFFFPKFFNFFSVSPYQRADLPLFPFNIRKRNLSNLFFEKRIPEDPKLRSLRL